MADEKTNGSTTPEAKAAKTKAPAAKAKPKSNGTIFVRSLLKGKPGGGDAVVLFERDDRHPGGEAYVAGNTPVEVFPTPQVAALIREEKLEEVEIEE